MINLSKNKNRTLGLRLLRHALFWIGVVLLLSYHGSLFGGDFLENALYMIAMLPVQIIAAYTLTYFQVPKILFERGWLPFVVSGILIAYLLAALARLSVIYIGEPMMGVDGIDESLWEILTDPMYLVRVYVISAYLPAVLFFLIKMTKDSLEKENRIVSLEKEKQATELNFLKAQINPHFLFNTLNNIYALAKQQSTDTPEMILKLSEILDYTIYECKNDRVRLSREWELIENYADLQALRNQDKMTIVLNQEMEYPEIQIAPLILISLVENAFKFGLRSKDATVDISLLEKNRQLTFKVNNTKPVNLATRNKGIGIENLKRQLELQYPEQYYMDVIEEESTYKVILRIHL